MVDSDLLEELDTAAARAGGLALLPAQEARDHVQAIASSFVIDSSCRWWWEALGVPSNRIRYGTANGLSALADLVKSESCAMLVVTDDAEPPWPVYFGNTSHILAVLRDCRFFEYILAAQDGSWVVFDTHMNELVVAGRLVC